MNSILTKSFNTYLAEQGKNYKDISLDERTQLSSMYFIENLIRFRDNRKRVGEYELAMEVVPAISLSDSGRTFVMSIANYHGYKLSTRGATFIDTYNQLSKQMKRVNEEAMDRMMKGVER